MELGKYIYPIKSSDTDGNGVLIGKHFVTVGHVIETAVICYVTIENKTYELTKESALVIRTNNEGRSDGYDLAVFKFEDIEPSPLVLSSSIPSIDIELNSICYNHKSYGTISSNNIFCSPIEETWTLVQNSGHIISVYDNYIECELNGKLQRGNSGSPLMYGNSVVGILYGDKDGKESSKTVLFLSSEAIARLLKNMSIDLNAT